jgi:hypothetical protein
MKKETQQRIENKVRSRTNEKFDWMAWGRFPKNAPKEYSYSDVRFTVAFGMNTAGSGIYEGCEPHMFWAFTTDEKKSVLIDYLGKMFPNLDVSVIPVNIGEEQSGEVSSMNTNEARKETAKLIEMLKNATIVRVEKQPLMSLYSAISDSGWDILGSEDTGLHFLQKSEVKKDYCNCESILITLGDEVKDAESSEEFQEMAFVRGFLGKESVIKEFFSTFNTLDFKVVEGEKPEDEIYDWSFYGTLNDNVLDNTRHADVDRSIRLNLDRDGILPESDPEWFWAYASDDRKDELTNFLHANWPDLDFSIIPFGTDWYTYSKGISV